MVEIIKIDGYIFRKYPDAKQSSGRHYYRGWVSGVKTYLHRYIWQKENGEIPKGFTVHHIDGDFDNNQINNYGLKTLSNHVSDHYKDFTKEYKDNKTKILLELAQPEAIKWHGSKEGIEWHKTVAYNAIYGKERTFICKECGELFVSRLRRIPMYCSKRCKSRFIVREFYKRKRIKQIA